MSNLQFTAIVLLVAFGLCFAWRLWCLWKSDMLTLLHGLAALIVALAIFTGLVAWIGFIVFLVLAATGQIGS